MLRMRDVRAVKFEDGYTLHFPENSEWKEILINGHVRTIIIIEDIIALVHKEGEFEEGYKKVGVFDVHKLRGKQVHSW